MPAEGISRRGIFDALAAGSLVFAAAETAEAADEPPKIEPIAPFKYNIESKRGWQGEGGSAKEATVEEFPISQSIAGVSMRLKPGSIRELHWHALAAEWAYVLEGRVRTTVISPDGQTEVDDFVVGDTWYFPKGHGHALQNMGPGPAHFLLVFDDGHFSEFGTFGVSDWIANTPPSVVSRTLGVPEAALAQFPKKELYIGPGRVPPATEELRDKDAQWFQSSHKFRMDKAAPHVFPGGREYRVTAKEFPIQTTVSAVHMVIQPGGLREMHWHPHADEWQYYVKGRSRVGVFGSHGRSRTEEFGPGQVAFIKAGYGHYVEQVGDEPTEILIVFNSPEYQQISLANWMGQNPISMLETNFPGVPRNVIDRFPVKDTGILGKRG